MRAHIVTLACVLIGVELQGQSPASGAVAPATVVQIPSPSLNDQRSVTVLLPTGYSESDRRYPVLYLLHGGGQDHTVFATRGWFGAQASRGIIIVTPNAGESWYVNSVVDPKARYQDFIVKDLVSYIDSNYRTIATRQGRSVAGVSMGAWGAMLLGRNTISCLVPLALERALSDFASVPEHGHDVPGTADVWQAGISRATGTRSHYPSGSYSGRVRAGALSGERQSGHLRDRQPAVRRTTDRAEDPVRISRSVAAWALLGFVGRSVGQLY